MSGKRGATKLFTMNSVALRALAAQWFMRGFAHSGRGFNGETFDLSKHPALESLLMSEFERVYKETDR